jgi:hypothetical protein
MNKVIFSTSPRFGLVPCDLLAVDTMLSVLNPSCCSMADKGPMAASQDIMCIYMHLCCCLRRVTKSIWVK